MFDKTVLTGCLAASFVLAVLTAVPAGTIEMVPVDDAGNAADSNGLGRVTKRYTIGKYEVTAGQYRDFLNTVAKTDPYGLYNASMDDGAEGCQITRHGSSGSYTYDFSGRPSGTEADWVNRPVNCVSWGSAVRFANWLHNGQPADALTGVLSHDVSITEGGAYNVNGATTGTALMAVTRQAGATWWIPSEDEWYKAAFYDPNKSGGPGYWDYPTKSDTTPSNVGANGYTDPGNHANYWAGGFTIGNPYCRTIVGEFEKSASPYGTFDQAGNVAEWNETVFTDKRGSRGGSYFNDSTFLDASTSQRSRYPLDANYYGGFRVASVPEPGSIMLLCVGMLCLLAGARR